ncbi:MAG: ferredoxin [Armatimonadota bacterium]|nr:ferredoxin [bacterium]
MKAIVTDDCISCGTCVDICPEVFDICDGEKAFTKVDKIDPHWEAEAKEACEACPVDAIILEQ